MRVIHVRNVHQALPVGLRTLQQHGVYRNSRNGRVLVATTPVTTVYQRPQERVLFWPERDANPFFHLYESLWMLAGRNDLQPLTRYVSTFGRFSDNGETLHGAYGHRWRFSFDPLDQLQEIADRLMRNADDRRCVLQMWDAGTDLEFREGKDLPCNLVATFQVNHFGQLDLVVFCRSNDIIWGAYGANAVHFSFLLEYMSIWTGFPMGTYSQVSVNWHAYERVLQTLQPLLNSPPAGWRNFFSSTSVVNPYEASVIAWPMGHIGRDNIQDLDDNIHLILSHADNGFRATPFYRGDFWIAAYEVLKAHEAWRTGTGRERYTDALEILKRAESLHYDKLTDWVVAAREWIERRYNQWLGKESTISAV